MNRIQRDRVFSILWVGGLMCIGLSLLVSSIFDGVHFYAKPKDLKPSINQVHLGGEVLRNSLVRLSDGFSFDVGDGDAEVHIMYKGVLPPIFREGQQVVVVGRQDADLFIADRVYAKHDEYYRERDS